MIRVRLTIALALFSLAAVGCGGGDLVLPNEGQAAKVVEIAGDAQTGTILAPAAESLVVRVVDRFDNPVPGVEVSWSPQGGGDVSPASVVTGADGRAATQRMLGAQVGSYGTTAVATPLPESAVTFTTTAVAAKLLLVTQPGPLASSGTPFDPQPILELQDPTGAPLARAGVSVTVQIASGDGALRGTTTRESDADGRVEFTDLAIAGPPGTRTLIFAADGYASAISTPVSLGVGAPSAVAVSAGDGQSVRVGTAVPVPPAVVVRDGGGTPVPGIPVTFAVASGGGTLTGAAATTGADGIATVGGWTLGSATGANTLTATVGADGVSGNPVTFTATALPGAASASKSSVEAAPKTIPASTGSSISIVTIKVRDATGNPISGQTVTLSATGAGRVAHAAGSDRRRGHDDRAIQRHGLRRSRHHGGHGRRYARYPHRHGQRGRARGSPVHGRSAGRCRGDGNRCHRATPGRVRQPGGRRRRPDRHGGGRRQRVARTSASRMSAEAATWRSTLPRRPAPTSSTCAWPASRSRARRSRAPSRPARRTRARRPPRFPTASYATPLEILVQVADAQGNPVGRGGDAVVVTPGAGSPIAAEDRGDGTYRVVWTPITVGTVKVAITLNGVAIHGSPYTTHIRFFR